MSNKALILSALKRRKRKGLTAADAVEMGIYRLAPRIMELREAGHVINTIMEEGENRHGEKVRYARYVLA